MDAVKFLQERARMCNSFSPECEGCRVDEEKPVMSECYRWMFENPERAVKIVEEWAKEHPRKTRQDEFLERWPGAIVEDGVLILCPKVVMGRKAWMEKGCGGTKCNSCRREFWMQEVE